MDIDNKKKMLKEFKKKVKETLEEIYDYQEYSNCPMRYSGSLKNHFKFLNWAVTNNFLTNYERNMKYDLSCFLAYYFASAGCLYG